VDARFLAFVAVMSLLIVTPGPDMAMVTRQVFAHERRTASFTALGIGLGSAAWVLVSALGIGVLLEKSVIAFTILKLAGAAYLTYLGLRSIFRREARPPGPEASPQKPVPSWKRAVRQGIASNLLNPKAAAIFVSVLPQFLRPGDSPIRLLLMLCAYEILLLAWLNAYAFGLAKLGRSRGGVRARRVVERLSGAVLIGLGARLAFERR
jgi:threonine/homoserine/homoserine lactone efflux protein